MIVAFAAIDDIIARTAIDHVITGIAGDIISARSTVDHVIVGTAVDGIVAAIPGDRVVASATIKPVRAYATIDAVIARKAVDGTARRVGEEGVITGRGTGRGNSGNDADIGASAPIIDGESDRGAGIAAREISDRGSSAGQLHTPRARGCTIDHRATRPALQV